MTPHELAERRLQLAAEYARDSELLGEILSRRPALWQTIRETVKSDKASDRAYEATQDGIALMRLQLKMKANEKKMSAAKTMLEVLNNEARNLI
jgi:hypothetical protein